jgi:hypothetical protein
MVPANRSRKIANRSQPEARVPAREVGHQRAILRERGTYDLGIRHQIVLGAARVGSEAMDGTWRCANRILTEAEPIDLRPASGGG